MNRQYASAIMVLLLFTTLLTACGGSKATDTPKAAAPTTAAPTTAAASATTATFPAGSSVAATTAPTVAAGSASATTATRPASSAATGSATQPTTASSASAIIGTRPAGSATTGSVAAGTTTAGSAAAGTGPIVFTDPKGRFSFSRPAAWMVAQATSPESIVQFTSSDPHGVVDISTESVASGITLDTYRDAAFAGIKKSILNVQQVGTTNLQLDSEPAVQIDYTGTVSDSTVYFSQIFALHKGAAYILTLGTQPADIAKMKQQAIVVVTSWKFLS
ncbi:MAG: hypothetical protein LC793_20710 [Thermomicrobia bacterium]|nr:hypothetical protein [Thermomicrobia bacterium]MCA1725886.1 hypothetical protein [Thermomicrobia bacterium]